MNLREFAKSQTILVKLGEGKEKGEMDKLIGTEVTINNLEIVKQVKPHDLTGEMVEEEYVAFTIVEDTKNFYFGGLQLSNLAKKIIENNLLDQLKTEGLKVKFTKQKSKNGNNKYTKVEVL